MARKRMRIRENRHSTTCHYAYGLHDTGRIKFYQPRNPPQQLQKALKKARELTDSGYRDYEEGYSQVTVYRICGGVRRRAALCKKNKAGRTVCVAPKRRKRR
jgi:hypothetical protein